MTRDIFILFLKVYFCVVILSAILYFIYKNTFNPTNIDIVENFELSLRENDKKDNNYVYYLYWTGGYDSTFRLCEMLINEKKIVQPIYVEYTLDNDCPTDKPETQCNKKWVRRNRLYEKNAMKEIRKALYETFPWVKKSLLPTLFIKEDIDDENFNRYFQKKVEQHNLWPKKRNKHQYIFLSKFAYYHKLFIDTGVLGIHNNSKFAQFLFKYLKPIQNHYISPITKNEKTSINYGLTPQLKQVITVIKDSKTTQKIKENHYMAYLRFPLFNRTKTDLLKKSKTYHYDKILEKTWSCWFPDPKTNRPCGKCPMCKERIIKHPIALSSSLLN